MRFFFVVCGFGLAVAAINLFSNFTNPVVPGTDTTFATANRSTEPVNLEPSRIVRVQTVASHPSSNRDINHNTSPVFDVTFIGSQVSSPGTVIGNPRRQISGE